MTRGPDESVPIAMDYGHYYPSGMCLNFVWTCIESPVSHGLPDANAAWNGAEDTHTDRNPPAGAPVYWGGGQHGHIALSLGGGNVRSTDWPGKEQVGTVSIDQITSSWGIPYRGWSTDYDGVPIPGLSSEDDDVATPAEIWGYDITRGGRKFNAYEWLGLAGEQAEICRKDIDKLQGRIDAVEKGIATEVWAYAWERNGNGPWTAKQWLGLAGEDSMLTNDRVYGMLRQKYYVMEGDVAKEVPKGTAGAIATDVLDAIDGNTIQRNIDALEPTLAEILAAVNAPPPPGPSRESLLAFAALIGVLGVVLGAALSLAIVAL